MLRAASSKAISQLTLSPRYVSRKSTVLQRKYMLRQANPTAACQASTSLPNGGADQSKMQSLPQLTRSDAQRQTIYALSTPPGKGGVAVVRISGPKVLEVWRRMVRPRQQKSQPTPWKLERCRIVHPENTEETIDDGLSVFFQGMYSPQSLKLYPSDPLHSSQVIYHRTDVRTPHTLWKGTSHKTPWCTINLAFFAAGRVGRVYQARIFEWKIGSDRSGGFGGPY